MLLTLRDIAAALCYLHSKRIVHGDLTGGNVLLAAKERSEQDPRGFQAKVWFSAEECTMHHSQPLTQTACFI